MNPKQHCHVVFIWKQIFGCIIFGYKTPLSTINFLNQLKYKISGLIIQRKFFLKIFLARIFFFTNILDGITKTGITMNFIQEGVQPLCKGIWSNSCLPSGKIC